MCNNVILKAFRIRIQIAERQENWNKAHYKVNIDHPLHCCSLQMHFFPICSHLSFTSNMHSSFSCCCRQFALTLKHFWPAQIYLLWKVNPRKIWSAFMLTLVWYFWSYIGVRYFLESEFLYLGSFFFSISRIWFFQRSNIGVWFFLACARESRSGE